MSWSVFCLRSCAAREPAVEALTDPPGLIGLGRDGRSAGKPVELIVQNGEDHWLSRGATRLATLTAAMAFVEKHNPPD